MDIGLSTVKAQTKKPVTHKKATKPQAKAYPVATMEQLYCQYIECENFIASSEQMIAYGDQLFETFDNLMSLRKTVKRFQGSAEGMAVLNELVGHEFGGSFEADDATQAAKTIWQRIGEFFQRIFSWFKNFFSRVLNFFGMAESRMDKTIAFLKAGEKVNDFEYVVTTPEADNVIKGITSGDANTYFNGNDEASINNKVTMAMTAMKLSGTAKVNQSNALQAAKKLMQDIGYWKTIKKSASDALVNAKAAVKTAQSKQDLPAAKLAQKKAAAFVKLVNKAAAIDMRSVSSFLANCKFQKGTEVQKQASGAEPEPAPETK